MVEDPSDFESWIELAKQNRLTWHVANQSDMPPMVFPCRNNEVIAQIICPQVDRDMGLKTAELCRFAMAADRIAIFFDARTITKKAQELNKDISMDDFKKKYGGRLEEMCQKDNAKEMGLVVDCITIHLATPNELCCCSVPYVVDGGEMGWWDDEIKTIGGSDGLEMEGVIPDFMRKIMSGDTILDNQKAMKVAEMCDLDYDRKMFHATRAAFKLMGEQGCVVMVKDRELIPDGMEEIGGNVQLWKGNPRFKI